MCSSFKKIIAKFEDSVVLGYIVFKLYKVSLMNHQAINQNAFMQHCVTEPTEHPMSIEYLRN